VALISLIFQVERLPLDQIMTGSLYLLRWVAYSLLTILLGGSDKKRSLSGLWVGGVGIGILGIIQYFLYPNLRNLAYLGWDPHEFRVFSSYLDPNFTGVILVLTIILSLDLIYFQKVTLRKLIMISLVPTTVALLLTYSRGSYLTLAVALTIWWFIRKQRNLVLIFMLIFGGVIFLLPHPGGEGVNLRRTLSIESRLQDSREAFKLFLTSPVFGYGFNTLRFFRGETRVVPDTQALSHSGAGYHNSFLFILTTTGFVGLIAYFWIWYRLIINQKRSNEDKQRINFLLFISFVVISTHSLFDNSLFYPPVMFWLCVLVGSTTNMSNTVKNHGNSRLFEED
jgi:O-antigen ligase